MLYSSVSYFTPDYSTFSNRKLPCFLFILWFSSKVTFVFSQEMARAVPVRTSSEYGKHAHKTLDPATREHVRVCSLHAAIYAEGSRPAHWKNLLQAWIHGKSLVSVIASNIYLGGKKKTKHFEKQYGAYAFYILVNENDLD